MAIADKINSLFDREEARYMAELSAQIGEMKRVLGPASQLLLIEQGHREVEGWMRARFAEARRDALRDLAEIGEAAWPQVAHGLMRGITIALKASLK